MHSLYRNIQYKPRIWGLYFSSLFTSLGIFLLLLMILSVSVNLFAALFLSIFSLAIMYGYFYFKDNRDEIEYRAKRENYIKNRLVSYSVSEQRKVIK